jgi:hypothetical protein
MVEVVRLEVALAELDPGIGDESALGVVADERTEGLHRRLAVPDLRFRVSLDEEHLVAARVRRMAAEQIAIERQRLLAQHVAPLGGNLRLGPRGLRIAIAPLEPGLHLFVVLLHLFQRGEPGLLPVELAELERELGLALALDEGKELLSLLDELVPLRGKLGLLARIPRDCDVLPSRRSELHAARRGRGRGDYKSESEGDHGCASACSGLLAFATGSSGSFHFAGQASLIVAW